MSWRDTWLVASRELTERARSRAFLASTAITLLLVAGVLGIVAITANDTTSYRVGLAGQTPEGLDLAIDIPATALGALVETIRYPDRPAAVDALEEDDVDAVVVDGDVVIVPNATGSEIETILEVALRQTAYLERLGEAGIDPAQAAGLLPGPADVLVVGLENPDVEGNSGEGIAIAAVVLLFIGIMSYGQWVLLGVLEEKTNRVVELVVSAVSVRALLAGKVLGIGLLGLGQLVVLIALGLGAGLGFDLVEVPRAAVDAALWALLWFLLGFAFYATLNAAAGSLVSRQEDAQTAATPLALLAVAMYLVTFIVILPAPESALARIVSLFPPVAPVAYPARIATSAVPLWEVAIGIAVMLLSVVGVIRVAARIYAGALLHTGSRVKVLRAWRSASDLVEAR